MAASIRPATIDDTSTIAQIHVAAWRWAYRGLIADETLQALSVADREAMWADAIPRGGVAVAVVADRIVGFVAFSTRADEEPLGDIGEVYAVYLLEESTRTGIGRRLLAHATGELRAQGFDGAVLWVLAENAGARRFYEAEGWRSDGGADTYSVDDVSYTEVRYAIDL